MRTKTHREAQSKRSRVNEKQRERERYSERQKHTERKSWDQGESILRSGVKDTLRQKKSTTSCLDTMMST
jgi:hypothetical protein